MNFSRCYLLAAFGLVAVLAASPSSSKIHRFTGPDGEDIPIHYTYDAPARIRKRANTPIICDPGVEGMDYQHWESHCDRQLSPQAWSCSGFLHDLNGTSLLHDSDGSCDENQICVDGVQVGNELATFCSDIQPYIAISQTMITKGLIQWAYTGEKGDGHAVETIFTDANDPTKTVTLNNLDITAEANQLILGKGSWKPLGTNACSGCSSLGIDPIPLQTSLFQIHTTFPAGISSARMYFWSM